MPSKHPRRRFQNIIDAVDSIRGYVDGLDSEAFEKDQRTVDAVERCLSRISEAAIKLDDLAEELVPNQKWDGIRGLGNHLRHEYEAVSIETIWGIVTDGLDDLQLGCKAALEKLPPDDDQRE